MTPVPDPSTDPTQNPTHNPTARTLFRLAYGSCTDTGRVRRANEDSMGAGTDICVVSDGLGGHNAGDIASAIAVATIIKGADGGIPTPEALGALVQQANRDIYNSSAANPSQRGMATTVTALAVLPGPTPRVMVANVGDSRTSLYRTGDFIRISKDHSLVQDMIDRGEIDPDTAWRHPEGNVLTRAVGIEPMVEVDVFVLDVMPRDRFLLCSDGLIDEVSEEDTAEILWRHTDPQECAEALVARANENGGSDNITVIVVDVVPVPAN